MASNIVFDGTKGISLPSFTTTEKNAIVSPATGATVFDTTQNRQNVYAGGAWNAGLNSGTSVTASGTSVDFTGIPSWVKRITVMLNGVSTSGTSSILVQLGTSGGYVITGYVGQANTSTLATAFNTGYMIVSNTVAANTYRGNVTITLISNNTWIESGTIAPQTTANNLVASAGEITLSGALDRVRITTVNGTDTFDAGSINILYE